MLSLSAPMTGAHTHATFVPCTLPHTPAVVGDVHGQFYDLLTIFELGGSTTLDNGGRFLFLGVSEEDLHAREEAD